nr:importin-5-like [Tanacetum cinerariifolium]
MMQLVMISSVGAAINFVLEKSGDRDKFHDLLPLMMMTLTEALNYLRKVQTGTSKAESLEEGTKHLAVEFAVTLVEAGERAPRMIKKLSAEIKHEDAGESSNYSAGQEYLDMLFISLGGHSIVLVMTKNLEHVVLGLRFANLISPSYASIVSLSNGCLLESMGAGYGRWIWVFGWVRIHQGGQSLSLLAENVKNFDDGITIMIMKDNCDVMNAANIGLGENIIPKVFYTSNWLHNEPLKAANENLNAPHVDSGMGRFMDDNHVRLNVNVANVVDRTTRSGCMVKDKQEKDKIGTKPEKNGKRGKIRQSRELGDRLDADKANICDAYTKLIKKVKKLKQTVKFSQASEMTKEIQKIYMQAERPDEVFGSILS